MKALLFAVTCICLQSCVNLEGIFSGSSTYSTISNTGTFEPHDFAPVSANADIQPALLKGKRNFKLSMTGLGYRSLNVAYSVSDKIYVGFNAYSRSIETKLHESATIQTTTYEYFFIFGGPVSSYNSRYSEFKARDTFNGFDMSVGYYKKLNTQFIFENAMGIGLCKSERTISMKDGKLPADAETGSWKLFTQPAIGLLVPGFHLAVTSRLGMESPYRETHRSWTPQMAPPVAKRVVTIDPVIQAGIGNKFKVHINYNPINFSSGNRPDARPVWSAGISATNF